MLGAGLFVGTGDGADDGKKLPEGAVLGPFVGDAVVGDIDCDTLGNGVGVAVGESEGFDVGESEGDAVGSLVGPSLGLLLGALVGDLVGVPVGLLLGELVGVLVTITNSGTSVGLILGTSLGLLDGFCEALLLGAGDVVGDADGLVDGDAAEGLIIIMAVAKTNFRLGTQ